MNAAAARAPVAVAAATCPANGGCHCLEAEYAAILTTLKIDGAYRRQRLAVRRRFVAAYPELTDWFDEPLARRVGRLAGEQRGAMSHRTSYDARSYLLFLGLVGHARFDYPWMLASGHLYVCELATPIGIELGLAGLIDRAPRARRTPRAELPAGVERGAFGPRLRATGRDARRDADEPPRDRAHARRQCSAPRCLPPSSAMRSASSRRNSTQHNTPPKPETPANRPRT